MSVECLMRKNIRTLEPYKCARDEAGGGMRVYLDANENFAPLVDYEKINRYPDSSNLDLRLAFEKAAGFPHTGIIAGNGSDELIDILFRIFCTPGEDCVLVLPPSYGEFSVLADINVVSVESCQMNSDFSVNEAALLEKIGYSGERIILFNAFAIDPAYWRRHKGRDFHNGLLSYFGKGSYFALLSRFNKPALSFFSSLGYFIVDEGADLDLPDKTLILMAKPYRKAGLCSESLF